MDVNLNDLTIGDLEEIEKISGATSEDVFGGKMSAAAIKAIVYVVRRREDPEFTLEDAANVRLVDVDFDDEPDPTSAAA